MGSSGAVEVMGSSGTVEAEEVIGAVEVMGSTGTKEAAGAIGCAKTMEAMVTVGIDDKWLWSCGNHCRSWQSSSCYQSGQHRYQQHHNHVMQDGFNAFIKYSLRSASYICHQTHVWDVLTVT